VIWPILFRGMREDLTGTSSGDSMTEFFYCNISQAKLLVPLPINTTKKVKHLCAGIFKKSKVPRNRIGIEL
jgi:hypothetical protein